MQKPANRGDNNDWLTVRLEIPCALCLLHDVVCAWLMAAHILNCRSRRCAIDTVTHFQIDFSSRKGAISPTLCDLSDITEGASERVTQPVTLVYELGHGDIVAVLGHRHRDRSRLRTDVRRTSTWRLA